MHQRYIGIASAVILLILGYTVWPTPYRFDRLDQKWPVRINRFTGQAQMLSLSGWQPLQAAANPSSVSSAPVSAPSSDTLATDKSNPYLQSNGGTNPFLNNSKPKLQCIDVHLVNVQYGDGNVTGIVKNIGKADANMVDIHVTVLGKNNVIFTTGAAFISAVSAGGQQSFDAPISNIPVNAKVERVEAAASISTW